jgi:hypothetical protein
MGLEELGQTQVKCVWIIKKNKMCLVIKLEVVPDDGA